MIAPRSTEEAGVFLEKCVRTATETMVVDRKNKKKEGSSSAISGVGTPAKCCEIKRCSDQVCSRTDNKDEILEGKFRNLIFSPPPKGQRSILLNVFFPLIDI